MSNGILKLPLSLAAHIGILAVPIPYNATTFATTELEFPCKADSDADVERRNVTIIEIGELLSVAEMRKAFPTNIPAKVYRVTRKSEFDGQIDTVVMKVAYNDMDVETLEREAGFYCNHLKCLQGRDVPTFYGLYALGPVIPRSPSIAIMVLEDGGDSLEVPLCEQPLQFRCVYGLVSGSWSCSSRILLSRLAVHQSLARIHHHGQIRHGDFAERNIVVRINQDGTESDFKAMIIDFERAEGHLCKAPETIALPITESPEFGDYCCRELHIVAEEACLWEPCECLVWSFFESCT